MFVSDFKGATWHACLYFKYSECISKSPKMAITKWTNWKLFSSVVCGCTNRFGLINLLIQKFGKQKRELTYLSHNLRVSA